MQKRIQNHFGGNNFLKAADLAFQSGQGIEGAEGALREYLDAHGDSMVGVFVKASSTGEAAGLQLSLNATDGFLYALRSVDFRELKAPMSESVLGIQPLTEIAVATEKPRAAPSVAPISRPLPSNSSKRPAAPEKAKSGTEQSKRQKQEQTKKQPSILNFFQKKK